MTPLKTTVSYTSQSSGMCAYIMSHTLDRATSSVFKTEERGENFRSCARNTSMERIRNLARFKRSPNLVSICSRGEVNLLGFMGTESAQGAAELVQAYTVSRGTVALHGVRGVEDPLWLWSIWHMAAWEVY